MPIHLGAVYVQRALGLSRVSVFCESSDPQMTLETVVSAAASFRFSSARVMGDVMGDPATFVTLRAAGAPLREMLSPIR